MILPSNYRYIESGQYFDLLHWKNSLFFFTWEMIRYIDIYSSASKIFRYLQTYRYSIYRFRYAHRWSQVKCVFTRDVRVWSKLVQIGPNVKNLGHKVILLLENRQPEYYMYFLLRITNSRKIYFNDDTLKITPKKLLNLKTLWLTALLLHLCL